MRISDWSSDVCSSDLPSPMVGTDANRQTEIEVDATTRLRAWRADDLDSLLLHADGEQVSRGTSDRFPFPYTRADGEAFLAGHVVDLDAPVFAIEIAGQRSEEHPSELQSLMRISYA